MVRIKLVIATAFLLCALLIITYLPLTTSATGSQPVVIFSEDLEHTWPGVLPNGWDRGDKNKEPVGDIDYWCRSKYNPHGADPSSGQHAAWCAKIGYNSQFGNAENCNVTRIDGNDPDPLNFTLRYDINMDSFMRHPLMDTQNYSSISMTFWYWSQTGLSSQPSDSIADYMWVSVYNSAGEFMIWKQDVANSSSWKQVVLNIPTDSTWISFNFHSGPTFPEGGPFIGAFLDDIVVTGIDDSAPVSFIHDLKPYYADHYIQIPVAESDQGSGLAYWELYYRQGHSGPFALYTSPENPTGQWTFDPVPFNAYYTGDGYYEFFTRAYDKAGNAEAMKNAPEAFTYLDTIAPLTKASVNGTLGNRGWYTFSPSITLDATDATSGVASTTYRIDGGQWQHYSAPFTLTNDGDHIIDYFSTDLAGKVEAMRNISVKADANGPVINFEKTSGYTYPSGDVGVGSYAYDDASKVASIETSLDDHPFQNLDVNSSSVQFKSLADGDHHLVIRASDGAGNQNQVTLNFKVGTSSNAMTADLSSNPLLPLAIIGVTVLAVGAMIVFSKRRVRS